ncbi:hypothetical protein B0H34DRAFT_669801 [Crassisporium funariophilum]|nr:hypothetical protein B0H34DRAFT_669801 [Crassisporium funariophilum]
MSERKSVTDVAEEEPQGVINGSIGKEPGVTTTVDAEGEEGEESDEYDDEEADYEEEKQIVGDEDDDEDDEEDDEDDGGDKNGLTHLLLGNPNEPVDGDDIDDEEDEADADEDEDEDYPIPEAPATINKKRSIDEVADEEDAQESKKVKA